MGQFIDLRANDSIRLIIATEPHLSRRAGSSFNDVITSVPANYPQSTVTCTAFLARYFFIDLFDDRKNGQHNNFGNNFGHGNLVVGIFYIRKIDF